MRHDRARIEAALAPLVGLPLWKANRVVDLQGFQLGAEHTRVIELGPHKGQTARVGEYALHLQCAWRVSGPDGIVVASRDLYVPAGEDPDDAPESWTWDREGANRRDERLARWLDGARYLVDAVAADALGGFALTLAGGHALEVFPDDSLEDEHWRLLQPATDAPHFVVTGKGIEDGERRRRR